MILMALAALVVLVGSCDWKVEKNDKGTKEEKAVKTYYDLLPFERIRINVPCDIYYTQGDTTKVKIVASKNQLASKTDVSVWGIKHSKKVYVKDFIDKIDVTSDGGWLQISKKKRSNWKRKNWVSIYITSPDLIEVDMHGAGSFNVEGNLDTDTLRLRLKGAGNMDFPNIICDRIEAHLKGVGDMDFHQLQTQLAELNLRGVGDIDAHFVKSGSVRCTLQGVGDIDLTGEVKSLVKKVQGTGEIGVSDLKINN